MSTALDNQNFTMYTTPADVVDLTGETATLAHCIAATALIKNYSGIHFDTNNSFSNKIYSGNGKVWLDLGYYPIQSVSSVKIDDTAITNYKTPAEHGEADGYLYRSQGWDEDVANIKVSFIYGYATLPQIVKLIATRIAALLANEVLDNVSSENIGGYSVKYVDNKSTQDRIIQLLSDLPKDSNIFATGQDGTSNTLSMNARLIKTGT